MRPRNIVPEWELLPAVSALRGKIGNFILSRNKLSDSWFLYAAHLAGKASEGSFELSDLSFPLSTSPLCMMLRRVAPFAPDQDFSPLENCVRDRWLLDRDHAVLAGCGYDDGLYVLGDGFAFDFSILSGRTRHIFDFYGPGAICNWIRPEREDTPENILFKARSEVLVLDRARLAAVLADDAMMAAALHEHEVRRAMRVSRRVRALISLPARDSLRIVLLDLQDEYGATGHTRNWLPVRLTQEEIGDLIGSTSVHVSRTMAHLERDGEIERRANTFRLSELVALRARLPYRRFFDPLPELCAVAAG